MVILAVYSWGRWGWSPVRRQKQAWASFDIFTLLLNPSSFPHADFKYSVLSTVKEYQIPGLISENSFIIESVQKSTLPKNCLLNGLRILQKSALPRIKIQYANLNICEVQEGPGDQYLETVCAHVDSNMELTQVPARRKQPAREGYQRVMQYTLQQSTFIRTQRNFVSASLSCMFFGRYAVAIYWI